MNILGSSRVANFFLFDLSSDFLELIATGYYALPHALPYMLLWDKTCLKRTQKSGVSKSLCHISQPRVNVVTTGSANGDIATGRVSTALYKY